MTGALARRLQPLAALAVLLALWQGAALAYGGDYLPPPTAILPDLWRILRTGEILPDIGNTIYRLGAGYALGLAVGVPLGLVCGRHPRVNDMVAPLLALFYPIPKAALVPIFMLWFGAGDLSKIIIIFLGVTLPLIYHSYQGARSVDEKLLWSAAAMGMGKRRQLWAVILPASLPEVLLGARVAIMMAVIVTVSSEMIVRQNGLGYFIFNALDMGEYRVTYAVVVVISGLAFVLDWLFEQVRRRLTFWAPQRQAGPDHG